MAFGLGILAAGEGRRAGTDKVLADLGGRPVLEWSIAAALASGVFEEIVVVAAAERFGAILAAAGSLARVVTGGSSRTASSWAAVEALPDAEYVAIHDAARPFVAPSLFSRLAEVARVEGSAVAGLLVADTLRRANEIGDSVEEVDRALVWSAQTPQIFRREVLAIARARAGDKTFSDDAAAVVAAGYRVRMVPGDARNFKITTLEDLGYARELVRAGTVGMAAALRSAE